MTATLLAVGLALCLAPILGHLMVQGGPVDRPRERGLHKAPTPTSGGLAVIAAIGCGLIALGILDPGYSPDLKDTLPLLAFAALMGVNGALDDLFDLPALPKLIVQMAAALLLAGSGLRVEALPLGFDTTLPVGPVLGTVFSALWILMVINAVNFMDGSNGLALGVQGYALVTLGVWLWPSAPFFGGLLLIAGAANLGFLPLNLPLGRIFQGDSGAFFSSALIAGGVLFGAREAAFSPWFGGFLLLPLLVDVALTLVHRARLRLPLMQAHRDHLYQVWLARTGRPHADLAFRVWGLSLISLLIGTLAELQAKAWIAQIFGLSAFVLVIGWLIAYRRLSQNA